MDNTTVPRGSLIGAPELSIEDQLCSTYLVARSSVFRELAELRRKGWKNAQGDTHFRQQRQVADQASWSERISFFKMMQRSGDDIQKATAALELPEESHVLDLCMAPGGYTASALKYNPTAKVSAITLRIDMGGHSVLVPHGRKDPRVNIWFEDITLFASEFGVEKEEIPSDHPDVKKFSTVRLWLDRKFDLVFCDGQVLRTQDRSSYREDREAERLMCSQLIFALQRIRTGGTLIMLLHKVDVFRTIQLLDLFDKIANIQLFKPAKAHASRSSFYLIAKNVQPQQPEALTAVEDWKKTWREATFPHSANDEAETMRVIDGNEVKEVLSRFGEKLIKLGDPIWLIQKAALGKAKWFEKKDEGKGLEEAQPKGELGILGDKLTGLNLE